MTTNAITIQNLTKDYASGTRALQEISLSISEGEFFGLLGQNGAGKTTTINILTGLTNKSSGTALLFDHDVATEYTAARSVIGLVPQEFNMDQFERVYKLLYFNAGYFGIVGKERKERITQLLTELGLWEKRTARVRELSGGMKRKLMIARALLHQPKILILDEPTAGVDVETRKAMWEYLRKLNKQGTTILLTTHYIEEAEELCERIGIIHQGKIIAIDKTSRLLNLFEQEQMVVYLSKALHKIPAVLRPYSPTLQKNKILFPFNSRTQNLQELLTSLAAANLPIERLETSKTTLEEVFLHLTKP